MIKLYILIAVGGALGAMTRHGCNQLALTWVGSDFPWGIMAVNILGSFLVGIAGGFLTQSMQFSEEIRAFIIVGVLGGFTTFSAFSLDALLMWERGAVISAVLYVVGSVLFSLLAAFCGMWFARGAMT